MNRLFAVTIVTIASMTTACSGTGGFISVEEKFGSSSSVVYTNKEKQEISRSGFHIVEKGDTLYSIAFRYGFNHRDLASANGISSPFTIYPGQKIDVRKSVVGKKLVKKPTLPDTVSKSPTPASKPLPKPVVVESSGQNPPVADVADAPLIWQWPSSGDLKARFSSKKPVNKGIDLAGSLGDSVSAAAAGTVVYAGQGLRGYGNLVIIKHDDTFLSAYAHASRILVNEKEVVKAGQTIAETGSTGTTEVKLHFEIRKNGKPVDPLLYLPPR